VALLATTISVEDAPALIDAGFAEMLTAAGVPLACFSPLATPQPLIAKVTIRALIKASKEIRGLKESRLICCFKGFFS